MVIRSSTSVKPCSRAARRRFVVDRPLDGRRCTDSGRYASAADVAPFAGHFAIGGSATQDFVAGNSESNSHIAQTGIWSGIKSAAKAVGGKVKSAAKKVVSAGKTVVNAGKTIKNGVQGLGNKVMNAGTTLGSKMTGAIKKGVSAAGKVIGNAPGVKQAKKLAQKIGTKIGKAIANRL